MRKLLMQVSFYWRRFGWRLKLCMKFTIPIENNKGIGFKKDYLTSKLRAVPKLILSSEFFEEAIVGVIKSTTNSI